LAQARSIGIVFLRLPVASEASMAGNFSWVKPFLETPWVNLLAQIAPSFPPPPEGTGPWYRDPTFETFEAKCATVPLVLILLGITIAFIVLCCPTDVPIGRRRKTTCLRCKGGMTLVLSFLGLAIYVVWGWQGYSSVKRHLGLLAADVDKAVSSGNNIERLGAQAVDTFNASLPSCSEEMQLYLMPMQSHMDDLVAAIEEYNEDIQNIPEHLHLAEQFLDDLPHQQFHFKSLSIPGLGMAAPIAPLLIVVLGVLFLIANVKITACVRANCCACFNVCFARIELCFLRKIGTLVFAPMIVLVATAAAVEIGGASALGSFCQNVDSNMLEYIHRLSGNTSFEVSRYYIQGNCSNPLLERVQNANTTLQQVVQEVGQTKTKIEAACADKGLVDNILMELSAMQEPISDLQVLLSAQHMYPYYVTMVHEKACGSMVAGLGWLVSLQYLIGVICLPLLICAADTYFQEQARGIDLEEPLQASSQVAPSDCPDHDHSGGQGRQRGLPDGRV